MAAKPAAEGLETLVAEDLEAAPSVPVGYFDRIRHEYAGYRATTTLVWDGVPAFNEGAAVPRSHPGLAGWVDAGVVVGVE